MAYATSILLCCCAPDCCQCDRSGETCCYHPDDVLTLSITKTHDPLRYCEERCASTNDLACVDCTDYLDTNDYVLSVCNGTTVEFTRVGSDTCFPKWIRRTCDEDEWKFYDDDDNLVPTESLPLCATCVADPSCESLPVLCGSIDPCDETLICCSDGEANMATPPAPFDSCTHDDGDPVGGTGFCFCAAGGCYSFDFKGWFPVCRFVETGECVGNGDEALACITLEVSFDIVHNCQDDGAGGCEAVP